ncbi:MAG: hypothetical protein IMZ47_08480 [Firmicutes bacterium]|nr:hypothetical protein [Bacillota bacterium]
MENKAKKKKPKLWLLVTPPILAGVVLFFVLPFLEKPRQDFLDLFGINPGKEESKSVSEFPCPGPFEVLDDIENAPLLQQDEVAQHYVGIQVDWTGQLVGIEKKDGGMLKLQVCLNRRFARTVCFFAEVNAADYPGIGLLKTGDKVRIKGYIKSATWGLINLRDATLIR